MTSPNLQTYPGAVVKIDQNLLKGTPTLVSLRRKPFTLSITGLAGAGPEISLIKVPGGLEPGDLGGVVNALINKRLATYIASDAYSNGSRPSSNITWASSSASTTTSLGIDLGVDVDADTFSVSASEAFKQSSELKTVFSSSRVELYKVKCIDCLDQPLDLFYDPYDATQVNYSYPPAVVTEVTYGSLMFVTHRSSIKKTSTDTKLSGKYESVSVSSEVSTSDDKETSSTNVKLVGASGTVSKSIMVLDTDATESAVKEAMADATAFSAENQGKAISYVTSFLGGNQVADPVYNVKAKSLNNTVAKINSTTSYAVQNCVKQKNITYSFKPAAAVIHQKFLLQYDYPSQEKEKECTGSYRSWNSKLQSCYTTKQVSRGPANQNKILENKTIPGNAKNIKVRMLYDLAAPCCNKKGWNYEQPAPQGNCTFKMKGTAGWVRFCVKCPQLNPTDKMSGQVADIPDGMCTCQNPNVAGTKKECL